VSHADVAPILRPDVRPVSARRRVLSIVALVLLPVGVVFIIIGLVRGFPELFYGLVAFLVACWAGWRALGHLGRRRWVWGTVAVVALVAWLVLTLAFGRPVLWLIVGVVVLFLGASAAGAALLHAPRQTPAPGSPKLARRSHHGALFINPKSGGGTAERVNLAEVARSRGIDATVLGKDDDLLELARAAVRAGADCLGAAGGDGTLALVAEVAIESGLPFVCIPAGTRNHFALDLGLDREDPLGALDAFGEAVERAIDVGDVSGHMFLNNVSIGAYGEIVANDAYRDNKVGTALLKLPELIGPDAQALDLRFTDGNGVEQSSALVIHVSNNSYVLTPRPGFGTRPSLCDGELGVAVVVGGVHGAPLKIEHWQAPTFSLTSGGLVAAGLDGEAMEFESPLEFSIRPGVLRARTSLNAPGVSPAAKAPPLSVVTVRRLAALSVGHVPA